MAWIRTSLVCAACTLLHGLILSPVGDAADRARTSGSLVYWDQRRGFDAIVANSDVLTDVSPFWYRVQADGRVGPYTTTAGESHVDPSIHAYLKSRGILVIPTVANAVDGVWDGAMVSRIIGDAQLRAVNVASLVDLAVRGGYDGIDLDYENLRSADRSAFTMFVQELAGALHAQGKLLTVNVYAKTSEPGAWDGPQAQDWSAIGQVADEIRIMAYEYSWSNSQPGPISPVTWVADVIAFARTQVAAAKIVQGIPLYGYDWVGQRGTGLVALEAMALANEYAVPISWDGASASPWFQYMAGPTPHTVWFENAASLDAKLGVAAAQDIGGISLWRLGGEDPGSWPVLRAWLGEGAPSGTDQSPPVVAITSPDDGATLAKKQRIEVQATDNVGVARVDFFVNGSLLASDTSAPYVTTWNTLRAPRGANLIEATAYDASGNTATARVTAYRR